MLCPQAMTQNNPSFSQFLLSDILSTNEKSNRKRLFEKKYITVYSLTMTLLNASIGKHDLGKLSALENLENYKKSARHVDKPSGFPGCCPYFPKESTFFYNGLSAHCPLLPHETVFLHNGVSGHYPLSPHELSVMTLLVIAHITIAHPCYSPFAYFLHYLKDQNKDKEKFQQQPLVSKDSFLKSIEIKTKTSKYNNANKSKKNTNTTCISQKCKLLFPTQYLTENKAEPRYTLK